jgi:hypothetical protein
MAQLQKWWQTALLKATLTLVNNGGFKRSFNEIKSAKIAAVSPLYICFQSKQDLI